MKIIETVSDLHKIERNSVLAIGNFDGVHIGHREILKIARQIADERKAKLVVMTFEPHPLAFLHPDKAPGVLTPLPLKRDLLAESGADLRLMLKTTSEILDLLPAEFVQRFLVAGVQPAVVVEGEDFHFGAARQGDIETLEKFGIENGFEIIVVGTKKVSLASGEEVKVSSTMIRYMLGSGKVADAAELLGRPYRLIGEIVAGKGKGKQIGYPTVNLQRPEQVIPAEGVYAGYVKIADSEGRVCAKQENIAAVFSIGQARTFGDEHPLLIEAHLLKKNVGNLCGKWMAMDFVEYIRKQHKFASPAELAGQIKKDCEMAKDILSVGEK